MPRSRRGSIFLIYTTFFLDYDVGRFNMRLGLINSAWVQANQPTTFGLRKTKELGFDCIDIFADPLTLDVRERRLIKDECDRLGLPIVSLPCVAVGLIDFNESVRQFHIERVQAYLELAYEYQAKNVLVVIGEYIWNREVIPPEDQWQLGATALAELGDAAAELDLEIVLELEPFPLSLVNTVETMARFLDDVGRQNVKANLDISHLVLSKVPAEEIRRLAGRVGHVHLSDCDG
jgi:sugar phosphate isomerase/epimerase